MMLANETKKKEPSLAGATPTESQTELHLIHNGLDLYSVCLRRLPSRQEEVGLDLWRIHLELGVHLGCLLQRASFLLLSPSLSSPMLPLAIQPDRERLPAPPRLRLLRLVGAPTPKWDPIGFDPQPNTTRSFPVPSLVWSEEQNETVLTAPAFSSTPVLINKNIA